MSKQHGKYLIKFGDQVRSYHSADPAWQLVEALKAKGIDYTITLPPGEAEALAVQPRKGPHRAPPRNSSNH